MGGFLDPAAFQPTAANEPLRIVSLVPSQTELLHHLKLTNEVVGITKFCVHPPGWFRVKARVGGTKNINVERVKALSPTLILANKEENIKEQVEELAKLFPVWVSDVNNLPDALAMIITIGTLTNKEENALALANEIRKGFASLPQPTQSPRTAYLIWREPYMTVGGDTFIHDMLQYGGYRNVFAGRQRYPAITIGDLVAADCKLLFLSSEPYPFQSKHIQELQQHLPETKVLLVDGEMFSWYGSRLLQTSSYLKALQSQTEALL